MIIFESSVSDFDIWGLSRYRSRRHPNNVVEENDRELLWEAISFHNVFPNAIDGTNWPSRQDNNQILTYYPSLNMKLGHLQVSGQVFIIALPNGIYRAYLAFNVLAIFWWFRSNAN